MKLKQNNDIQNDKSFPACYIALKLGIVGRMTIENSMAFNTGN